MSINFNFRKKVAKQQTKVKPQDSSSIYPTIYEDFEIMINSGLYQSGGSHQKYVARLMPFYVKVAKKTKKSKTQIFEIFGSSVFEDPQSGEFILSFF